MNPTDNQKAIDLLRAKKKKASSKKKEAKA